MHKLLLTLATELGSALKERNYKLAFAESCTGGMATQYITAIAGSSAWLDRSFVTYSNNAKIDMLDVSSITLEKFGAVSEQTAAEMAKGALLASLANVTASITGVAGPDGGTADKPLGTVCFSICLREKLHTETYIQHFTGTREAIRLQSVKFILSQLLIKITHLSQFE
ncbi:MAG: CinA family protein [Methylophilaceae bacterium]|nr:CinA family protein [Methylophilaceae bacterium]